MFKMTKLLLLTPKVKLLIFISFLISIPLNVISQTTELKTLLNIKQQLGNPPPIQSWNATSSPCSWPEIACTNGTVTGIFLRDINITVQIPPSICDLKNLTFIDFAWNYIPGDFPKSLYNCSKLQYLDLSENYFVGPIPDDINRLSTLLYLDLHGNNFTGNIPPAIGKLTNLQYLSLNNNEFNGTFPAEIGDLPNLVNLTLAFNKFVPMRIPDRFSQLKKLKYLWMKETNLIGEIPKDFSGLSNLEWLDLSTNNLEGSIPRRLLMLKNLTHLYLFHNKLSGEIPRPVKGMNLVEFDVSGNNLSGTIPVEFGKMQNLEFFNLIWNQFTGEIPSGMDQLPNLRIFRVFDNKLSGNLLPEFGLHSKLEAFEVCTNQFSGELPKNLCAGGALLGVVAFSNNLSGEIPASLGNCSSLLTVQLYNNFFTGEIPPSLWTSFQLLSLMVKNNSFSGELPSKLASNLSRIEISNNKFSGQIPTAIGSWSNLTVFEASNNLFSGEIPWEITNLSHLITLSLDGNQLSGQLPMIIQSWGSLITLNLAGNKLSGQIPAEFATLPDLLNLDLSRNQLSGVIPYELGTLKLTSLNLSSNKLSGQIPVEFNNLAYESSFLSNSHLCVDSPILKFPNCNQIQESRSKKYLLPLILALALFLTVSTIIFTFFRIRNFRRKKLLKTWKLTSFHRLNFTEVNILTSLTDANQIGSGGSGKVYKIDLNGSEFVAVKRIWNNKKLDCNLEKEFVAEVEVLGSIRHANIVKLWCCISSESSKLLVYEYMENSSLDRWIHGKKRGMSYGGNLVHNVGLNWAARMQIAIGAAQGLCYMHHDCSPPVIHRDIKSSNILLDSEFKARIADFGLAKILSGQGELHTMSAVAGSFGYLAPEYAYTTKVNEKIDVYSFGVVLLELVTSKEANSGGEHTSLAEWAWQLYSDETPLVEAFDPEITESCNIEEMTTVFKLGLACTSTLPSSRPSMKEVLHYLLRCGLESCEEKKMTRDIDLAPLLEGATYVGSYKDLKRGPKEDDYLVYSV